MKRVPMDKAAFLAASDARIARHASRAHGGAVPARIRDVALFIDMTGTTPIVRS